MSNIQQYRDVKVTLIGESSVGKTSLTRRIAFDKFTSDSTSTIGAAYCSFKKKKDYTEFTFKMWDTAGQERYKSLVPMYVSGSEIILLVFDITNVNSFEQIDSWLEFVLSKAPDASLLLIGSKTDLEFNRNISSGVAENFAKYHKMTYIECSAKDGVNIDKILECMVNEAGNKTFPDRKDIIPLGEETEKPIETTWSCINRDQCNVL